MAGSGAQAEPLLDKREAGPESGADQSAHMHRLRCTSMLLCTAASQHRQGGHGGGLKRSSGEGVGGGAAIPGAEQQAQLHCLETQSAEAHCSAELPPSCMQGIAAGTVTDQAYTPPPCILTVVVRPAPLTPES